MNRWGLAIVLILGIWLGSTLTPFLWRSRFWWDGFWVGVVATLIVSAVFFLGGKSDEKDD